MRLVRHAFLVGITAFTLMAQAAERPESMVKMVVRVTGPGLRPNSFSSLPKTIYRAGSYYARIEDPPDSKQQIQKLIIIVEPDAYSVNLADKKGTHALEQGGPNDLHLSIALPFDPKRELGAFDQLEFGDEVGFFQGASAKKEIGPEIGKSPTDVFRLKIPSGIASLFLRRGTQIPMLLTWEAKDREVQIRVFRVQRASVRSSTLRQACRYRLPGDHARYDSSGLTFKCCSFVVAASNFRGGRKQVKST